MLLALLLAQVMPYAGPTLEGPIFSSPATNALPAFSAFTSNGRGVDSPETLCSNFTAADQAGAWLCMNGDGTFVNQTLTKTGSDTDATGYVCGGGDVLMAARNSGGTSGARWSAASSRVGAANYTTCAHVVPIAAAAEQPVLTWASGGSGAQLGISPFVTAAATGFSTYMANGSPCNSITAYTHTTALVPGAAALLCVRVSDTATDVDMFVNGIKYTPTTVCTACGCDDGTAQTYSVNSYGGSSTSGNASRILGAFATETALSDARIQAISAAVLGVTHTGAKGETLTVTTPRTTGGTVLKGVNGMRTTGIANGDLVMCGPLQQRVAKAQNGTVRAQVNTATQNFLVRSQAIDNAAWLLAQGGAPAPGNPTVTANSAVQPDGTTTAERVDFPAVSGTGFSVVYQGVTGTATQWTASCYARGVSGSGTFYMMLTPGGTYASQPCSYVSTEWKRCSVTATETAAAWFLQLGVDLRDGTQTGQSAQSVYITDCQWELGSVARPYVPTEGSSATANADAAPYFTVPAMTVGSATFSVQTPSAFRTSFQNRAGVVYADANNVWDIYVNSACPSCGVVYYQYISAVGKTLAPAGNITPSALNRIAMWVEPSTTIAGVLNGTETTNGTSVRPALTGVTRVYICDYTGPGYEMDGLCGVECVDTPSSRCR